MLPSAEPSVIFQKVADGAVLFAPVSEIYFGLNDVGSRIWEMLPPVTGSLDELCARIGADFPEVPPATIRTDIEELLSDLLREGLLVPHVASSPVDVAAR